MRDVVIVDVNRVTVDTMYNKIVHPGSGEQGGSANI